MLKKNQLDRMISVLYHDGKLDLARTPGTTEQAVYRLLQDCTDYLSVLQILQPIVANTIDAARLPLNNNLCSTDSSVSTVASVITATAVAFPEVVFIKQAENQRPAFLLCLDEAGVNLKKVSNNLSKENREIYQRWIWGVAVGVVQTLRWTDSPDLPDPNGLIYRSTYIKGIREALAPFFLELLYNSGIGFMNESLIGRVSAEISELRKEKENTFYWFLRSIVEQESSGRVSPFGSQIIGELRDRFWFSLGHLGQSELILHGTASLKS